MAEQPPYGDWLSHPNRAGYVDSIDPVLPDWDQGEELIVYLSTQEKEAMTLYLIRAGLLKPQECDY